MCVSVAAAHAQHLWVSPPWGSASAPGTWCKSGVARAGGRVVAGHARHFRLNLRLGASRSLRRYAGLSAPSGDPATFAPGVALSCLRVVYLLCGVSALWSTAADAVAAVYRQDIALSPNSPLSSSPCSSSSAYTCCSR